MLAGRIPKFVIGVMSRVTMMAPYTVLVYGILTFIGIMIHCELDLIGDVEYHLLRTLFKHKIPNWEGK